MRIGVIGGGSVGLLISSYMASRHQVTIYVRNQEQKEYLNLEGIRREGSKERILVKAEESSKLHEEDCFMVCVKQGDVAGILPVLRTVHQRIPVVFLQNGMGHLPLIASLERPVLLGVVEHGALKLSDSSVIHTGKGAIKMAAYLHATEQSKKLVDAINQSDFPVHMEKNWFRLLAEKLMVNAVINPITALFDTKNGAIIDNRYLHRLAKRLSDEAALVLELDACKQWERILQVAANTAENTSSMLKDLKEERETELEAITGYLIKVNKYHQIPNTLFVYDSVKALEAKKGIID